MEKDVKNVINTTIGEFGKVDVLVNNAGVGLRKYLSETDVDEIFCLNFRETTVFAVADAYQEWHDLTDREVLELLKK